MPHQSLAETLASLADASATQPRSRLQSPFEPLVGWLATLWASDRKAAKRGRSIIPEPVLFTSPASLHKPSNTPPLVHSADTTDIALHDDDDNDVNDDNDVDDNDDDNDDASDMLLPLSQTHKDGLTEEDVDYVVNSLLEYLERAKVASPESGCEDYEYYAPGNAGRRLRHGLWFVPPIPSVAAFVRLMLTFTLRSPASSMYVLYGSEDGDDRSEAETLEMDEAYDRASLELSRTECYVPELVSALVFPRRDCR